jgi:putative transposase
MRKSRYTDEQVAFALKQAELGTPWPRSAARWRCPRPRSSAGKQRFGGLGPSELASCGSSRRKTRKLKKLVADLSLDKAMLQEVSGKKALTPGRRRELVRHVQDRFGVSERRGCAALRFHRSSQRYRATRDDQAPLRLRIREIAAVRVRYGYPRIHILLRREGWPVNRKRVYRLYRQEGLSLRHNGPSGTSWRRAGASGQWRRGQTSSGRWTSSPTRSSTGAGSEP